MKETHTTQRMLIRYALIGVALECLYLLVYALAPIATFYPQALPLAQTWSWVLAPSRLLFAGAWAGSYSNPGLYLLLLGISFVGLGCIYLFTVISACDMNSKFTIARWTHQGDRKGLHPTSSTTPALTMTSQRPDAVGERVATRWLLLPLVGAGLFGITLLFLPALFSTDVFTYITAGHMPNMYYAPPFATLVPQFPPTPNYGGAIAQFRPVLYGPLWLGIASLFTRTGADLVTVVLLFRGFALLAHFVNCVLVWAILDKIAPSNRLRGTLLYAWNPLVLIELVVNGHNDGVVICLLLLAVWFYVQQRGKWFDIAALLCWGLAIGINLMVVLLTPLLLWFMVRHERHIGRAMLGFGWRALCILAIVCIVYAPVWQGGATFLAITSSIDLQNFMYSLLAFMVMPLRALYSQLTGGISLPSSLLQPASAADTTILASTLFIFALLYFQAMGRVRRDTTDSERASLSHSKGGGGAYDVLFTGWAVVLIGFVMLASTLFWPWYIVWVVWVVALRRFDAFTIGALLLSCTALLYYPFLYLDTAPIGMYLPLCIFGVPLVYLIVQRYRPLKRVERKKVLI